jgi:hypothetical protein
MRPWTSRARWLQAGGAAVITLLSGVSCAMGPDEFGPQVTTSSLPVDSDMSQFREVLSPYGTWMDLPDVGWVWRPDPNVVGTDFVPYATGGQWAYSDWGWTFETSWDWGWAPFHYGRWFRSPAAGWVWWPDSEWAPAWVDWRWGDGFVGWLPLTPPGITLGVGIGLGWTFVGANDFVSPNVVRYRLPPDRAPDLLRRTQPVGERVQGRVGHWNRGPEPERVARAIGHPVPASRPMTPPTGHPPRARTGNAVAPPRPETPAPHRAPPTTVAPAPHQAPPAAAPAPHQAAPPPATVAPHEHTEPAPPHEQAAPPHEHTEPSHPAPHPSSSHHGHGH